jgi:hypothetical protein
MSFLRSLPQCHFYHKTIAIEKVDETKFIIGRRTAGGSSQSTSDPSSAQLIKFFLVY